MITCHQGAFCLPGERINRHATRFGVYGADGRVLPDTAIATSVWRADPAAQMRPPREGSRICGPALFAGSADKQFGFVLLNSLGRLWALDHLPAETMVVFAAKPQARVPDFSLMPRLLRSLGLRHSVVVADSPLHFDALHTAPEWFGEATGARAAPGFYDWLDRRWPAAGPPDPDQAIYVSRRGLGPLAGRFACEDHLERLLAAEGYRIFRPEAHGLAEQIAAYRQAGRLIFAEGSALHLYALLRRPGQISAVIQRRPVLPAVMQTQMTDREGPPPQAISAVQALWWRAARGDHLGLSELDFTRLHEGLRAAGLIRGTGWQAPDAAAVQASLHEGLAPGQTLMTPEQRRDWLRGWRQQRG